MLPTAVTETDRQNNRDPMKIFEDLGHSRSHFHSVSFSFYRNRKSVVTLRRRGSDIILVYTGHTALLEQ
jgi:hypothetical protein